MLARGWSSKMTDNEASKARGNRWHVRLQKQFCRCERVRDISLCLRGVRGGTDALSGMLGSGRIAVAAEVPLGRRRCDLLIYAPEQARLIQLEIKTSSLNLLSARPYARLMMKRYLWQIRDTHRLAAQKFSLRAGPVPAGSAQTDRPLVFASYLFAVHQGLRSRVLVPVKRDSIACHDRARVLDCLMHHRERWLPRRRKRPSRAGGTGHRSLAGIKSKKKRPTRRSQSRKPLPTATCWPTNCPATAPAIIPS